MTGYSGAASHQVSKGGVLHRNTRRARYVASMRPRSFDRGNGVSPFFRAALVQLQ